MSLWTTMTINMFISSLLKNRSWIGLESVSGRPTYALYITDLIPQSHRPNRHETDKKMQNFQWIGQLLATNNVAEDTEKPIGLMSRSFRVRFGMESPDLRPIDNRHDTDWKPIISTMLEPQPTADRQSRTQTDNKLTTYTDHRPTQIMQILISKYAKS